jgi:hypothetical protein
MKVDPKKRGKKRGGQSPWRGGHDSHRLKSPNDMKKAAQNSGFIFEELEPALRALAAVSLLEKCIAEFQSEVDVLERKGYTTMAAAGGDPDVEQRLVEERRQIDTVQGGSEAAEKVRLEKALAEKRQKQEKPGPRTKWIMKKEKKQPGQQNQSRKRQPVSRYRVEEAKKQRLATATGVSSRSLVHKYGKPSEQPLTVPTAQPTRKI